MSALTMALARTGHPGDVIHHSDKGSQYTSLDFAFAAVDDRVIPQGCDQVFPQLVR